MSIRYVSIMIMLTFIVANHAFLQASLGASHVPGQVAFVSSIEEFLVINDLYHLIVSKPYHGCKSLYCRGNTISAKENL